MDAPNPEQLAQIIAFLENRRAEISATLEPQRARHRSALIEAIDIVIADIQQDIDEAASYASLGGAEGVRELLEMIDKEGYTPFSLKDLEAGLD